MQHIIIQVFFHSATHSFVFRKTKNETNYDMHPVISREDCIYTDTEDTNDGRWTLFLCRNETVGKGVRGYDVCRPFIVDSK
jgi:hypothetical protein